MRYQFASGRQKLPFPPSAIAVTGGGAITIPRTLYFGLLGETPGGFNLMSDPVGPISVAAGQKVVITLPTSVRGTGESWESFVIASSETASPSSFVQLCKVPAVSGSGAAVPLPIVIELDSDGDLLLGANVPSPASLPAAPQNGQLRSILSIGGAIFEFIQGDARPVGTDVLAAVGGRWIYRPGSFSTYIESASVSGCDRPLELVPTIPTRVPRYSMGGSNGVPRVYWLRNTGPDPIPAGRGVSFVVSINGEPQSNLFDGLIMTQFRGYANPVDGTRRTTYIDSPSESFPYVDQERPYSFGRSSVVLPDDLLPGEAFAIAVYFRFSPQQLGGQVAQLSVASIAPRLREQEGVYSESGELFGNIIFSTGDRRLIVPGSGLSVRALKGSGLINNLSFSEVGPTDVSGLQPNTANQVVSINGNGAVYVLPAFDPQREAKRAIVGCQSGVTRASAWSATAAIAVNNGIAVTLTHPVTGDTAAIRPGYPDSLIAGLAGKARFNPPLLRIYVELGGVIRQFSGLAVAATPTQEISITNWLAGTIVTDVPAPSAGDFGLFDPVSAAIAPSGVGNFPAGTARVRFLYEYDGNAVTSISHRGLDVVHTAGAGYGELEEASRSWGAMVSEADISSIPARLTFPYQRRRTTTDRPIYYDPISTAAANGTTVWRPAWRLASEPGRWLLDAGGLKLSDVLPLIIALGG